MINLREITKENLIPIIDLDVGEDQKDQVAPNSVSIAEGNYSETAWFKGIFNGDIPVGFVMLNLNIEEKNAIYGGIWLIKTGKKEDSNEIGMEYSLL